MRAFVAAFTRRGAQLGAKIASELDAPLCAPQRIAESCKAEGFESLAGWTESVWQSADALIFVGAAGIAVRAIAPHVKDKFTDPAVVSVDEAGRFALPLLSGHVGGANELAERIARLTGGVAAVSTATDVNGLFAVDVWAEKNGLAISDRALAKETSARLLEGEEVRLVSEWPISGEPPRGVSESGRQKVYITHKIEPQNALRLIPRCVSLGIGCRRGTSFEDIDRAVRSALAGAGIDIRSVAEIRSIDLKKDEAGLLKFAESLGLELKTYTAQELMAVPGEFEHSDFVQKTTGADNVCERAAALGGGRLIMKKTALGGVTAAAAMGDIELSF